MEEQVGPPPPPPRGPWGNPWLWLALLALAVVVGAILLIAALAGRQGTEEQAPPPPPPPPAAPTTVVVPSFLGLDHADAGRAAEDAGLVADTFPVESTDPAGRVVAQDPAEGTEFSTAEHVRLDIAIGPDPLVAVVVPDALGAEEPQAREIVRRAGFTVMTADRPAPTPEDVGRVLEQDPAPGTEAAALTQITLYVGR